MGLERVGGQRPHHLAALRERAAEAGVNVRERVRVLFEETVKGVRERAVGRKAHRVGRAQDCVEPRVLAAVVASRERRLYEAVGRHRHEFLSLEPQQARRVAGDSAADRREQPRVAVLGRERGRQVARDIKQRRDRRGFTPAGLFVRQRSCRIHNGGVLS